MPPRRPCGGPAGQTWGEEGKRVRPGRHEGSWAGVALTSEVTRGTRGRQVPPRVSGTQAPTPRAETAPVTIPNEDTTKLSNAPNRAGSRVTLHSPMNSQELRFTSEAVVTLNVGTAMQPSS